MITGTGKILLILFVLIVVGVVATVVTCGTTTLEANFASWVSQITIQAISLSVVVLVLRYAFTEPLVAAMKEIGREIGSDAHPIHLAKHGID